MSISPARVAAFEVLNRIERDRALSSFLLPQSTSELSPKDRGLAYEIALGVLRNQIPLDRLIATLTKGRKLDREVAIALRIGIYQMRFLDRIPAYSAISESVELVRYAKKSSAKPFVNAVLRKFQKTPPDLAFSDEIDRIAVQTSHPRWLIEKWASDVGVERTAFLAKANNAQPETAFRVIRETAETKELINASRPSPFVKDAYLSNSPSSDLRPMVESGLLYLQGEASQMAAMAVNIPDSGSFLDVCAAPGGKTGLIARRFGGNYKQIAAGDLYWPRVEHLRRNCQAQGASDVSIVQYDAVGGLPFSDGSFDSVLVDAPCSGTGTIRRNPEIRYFLKPKDFAELSFKQLAILRNASKLVRKGGSLVYSTCSFEPEENERVCEAFIRECDDFALVPSRVDQRFITDEGFARTWPDRDGMDGFFIASFGRR